MFLTFIEGNTADKLMHSVIKLEKEVSQSLLNVMYD